ncbi:MAG: helix-turn-helix domain-containing protein [Flavobacteriales bacterium]|nr:helix-turn-helix domain-containing protein [Flavobacteriales bacterium]
MLSSTWTGVSTPLCIPTKGWRSYPPKCPPPGLQQLTPTEREVWRRIAHPNDEKYKSIYDSMGMSKRNFDKHVNSLYRKLDLHSRPGAVRSWGKFGG